MLILLVEKEGENVDKEQDVRSINNAIQFAKRNKTPVPVTISGYDVYSIVGALEKAYENEAGQIVIDVKSLIDVCEGFDG